MLIACIVASDSNEISINPEVNTELIELRNKQRNLILLKRIEKLKYLKWTFHSHQRVLYKESPQEQLADLHRSFPELVFLRPILMYRIHCAKPPHSG